MYCPKSSCPDSPVSLWQTPVCEIESGDLNHTYDPEAVSTENSMQPASSTPNSSVSFLPWSSYPSQLLADREATVKTTQKGLIRGSRALTSAENLNSLKKKERKKKEEAELKEKMRLERDQRRIRIDEEKEKKRLAKQQKKTISQVHQ